MVRRMKSSKMMQSSKGLYIVKNNGTIQIQRQCHLGITVKFGQLVNSTLIYHVSP